MIEPTSTEPTLVGQAMQVVSAVGLLLLVIAYLLNQRRIWSPEGTIYLAFNTAGAFLLTVYSAWIREWVFVTLEGFWFVVSLLPLLARRRAKAAPK